MTKIRLHYFTLGFTAQEITSLKRSMSRQDRFEMHYQSDQALGSRESFSHPLPSGAQQVNSNFGNSVNNTYWSVENDGLIYPARL